ncbi:MAG: mechanosensitive ion channel [Hellea sp.]|nr:mechanosensitive ion channel [Hellea sp.]
MSPRLLRAFFIVLICCFSLIFTQNVDAQTTEETETPVAEQVDDQTAPETPVEAPEAAPEIDPAEAQLLELARQKIETDRAYYQALTESAKAEDIAVTETEADLPVESGPSLFDPANLKAKAQAALKQVISWLKDPSFLAQIGAIILAFFLAPIFAAQLRKKLFFFRDPPEKGMKLKIVRDYVYRVRNFLRAIMLVALLALFAVILKAIPMFEQTWMVKIAQGIAVVFLIYRAIKEFLSNELLQKIGIWTAIPLALLAVFGYLDDFVALLDGTIVIPMGDSPITAMTLVKLGVFGGLFFYLGNLSSAKGQDAIRSQESLDDSTREVVAKLFQIILFVAVVILVMSFAGIPLSGLVLIFSAVGLGVGLGLQPIAANFVSGFIILFDRSVRKGDFIVLPDGQEGYVEAINMRSTTVETTDGKDIMVPNTTFIDNTYENWTHTDPAQRYEVYFGVAYDTDIEKLEDILIPAISAYDKVLMKPEVPDLELREFGPYSINFAIEFWVSGIDDGENKFTSDLNFIVWRTLKENGIVMPLPQREVKNLK